MQNQGGPSGGNGTIAGRHQTAESQRIDQTRAQISEVVGIMRQNVEKVIERDERLTELDRRADALQQGATQFETQAGRLKRKFWWQNVKMMIILGVIAVIVVVIIIISTVGFGGGNKDNDGGTSGTGTIALQVQTALLWICTWIYVQHLNG